MMEPQELINEKTGLFEGFKSYFSRQAKRSTITFVISCVLAGLCLFSAVSGYVDWLPCIVCCSVFLAVGCHVMIGHHKLAKANEAQEFLTNYDKYRKIGKCIALSCVLLLIAIVIEQAIYKDIKRIIIYGALLVLSLISRAWQDPYKRDIDRLRELVQQS